MRATKWNPDRLPERSLIDLDLHEMGPVTFGSYLAAGQGVRSATDEYISHLLNDPLFVARLTERVGLRVVEQILASTTADGLDDKSPADETADGLLARDNRTTIHDLLRDAGLSFLKGE